VDYVGDGYGHSYFRDAPTVASDVVLVLRVDLDPGTPGRPLVPIGHHLWSERTARLFQRGACE
jgi:hypothetical protein